MVFQALRVLSRSVERGDEKEGRFGKALALDPKILFFDEPSAGLDPITSKRLDDLINELRKVWA